MINEYELRYTDGATDGEMNILLKNAQVSPALPPAQVARAVLAMEVGTAVQSGDGVGRGDGVTTGQRAERAAPLVNKLYG